MLRAVQNVSWKQHLTNKELYNGCLKLTDKIRETRLRNAGHYWRSKSEAISQVLLWEPTHGKRKQGCPECTFVDQLGDDLGCQKEELPTLMEDRVSWRSHVMNIRTSSTW